MSWEPMPLSSLLKPSGHTRAGKDVYPILSITMKQGLVDQADKFKKRVASQDTSNYRVVFKNELVVGFPIDEGVLGFQTKYPAAIVSPAYDIWRLKDETQSYIPYLELFLRSPQARRLYASKMKGAVARRRSLTKDDFLKLEIPHPPLADQIRIAHLLGKVEGLIARRKQHLQRLDDLLKSVFLEMFGDPVRNEGGWKVKPCDKVVIDIQSGTSYGGEEKEFLDDDEFGVLKISAVTQGYLDAREFKAVKKSAINKPLRFIKKGDLLFSRANTIDLVAACCVVHESDDRLFLPDKLWVLTLDETLNLQYINHLLKNQRFRNLVRKQASGGHDSMLNISMKKFLSLNIPVPEKSVQDQFAAIVDKIENMKSSYQESLSEFQTFYGALSQKAFKGELDLSRVPLSEEPHGLKIEELPAAAGEQSLQTKNRAESIELPVGITDEYPMSNPEARERLLRRLFEDFLARAKEGEPFSLDAFWQEAHFKCVDYMTENDEHFGPAEYDLVKSWLFEAVATGRVEQYFDTENNRVALKKAG